jgi:folate-binding protein YgfZ
MSEQEPLRETLAALGAVFTQDGPVSYVQHYGDWRTEYRLAREHVGLEVRSTRGWIELTGGDRAAWLHNLVTNEVRNLRPGEGNYAFAADVKGRTLFDVNVLVDAGRIWLDMDQRFRERILAHLDRYVIAEDVTLTDRSADFIRLAVLGPAMRHVADRTGPGNAAAMAQLQHAPADVGGIRALAVRHDYVGLPALELVGPASDVAHAWHCLSAIVGQLGGGPVGYEASRCLRMEAGIPALGEEIDEAVIPPETGQIERGISYQKGCYLGQEVIERLRSRGALARRLVGLRVDDAECAAPAKLLVDEKEVGRLTSTCHSPVLGATLGMGYVKTAFAEPGRRVTVHTLTATFPAELIRLPITAPVG